MTFTIAARTDDPLPSTQAQAPVYGLGRTAWRLPRRQQTLYVTEGKRLVQSRGGDIKEIRADNAIQTPTDTWHWHGSDPHRFMTHPAITRSHAQRRTTKQRP